MRTTDRREFLAAAAVAAMSGYTAAEESAKAPLFKLGIVTYNVAKDWDLPTILKICKATGVAAVECRTTHKHGVEPSLNEAQRKDVKSQFADSGIVFWGCGSVCEFHSPDPAVVKKNIEDCKRFVDLVKDLGGKGVKVRPNGLPKDVSVGKTLEQIGKSLIECGKAAESAGIEIWVEVHGAGTQIPENVNTFMEHCGHKSVGLTWNSNPSDVKDKSVKESFDLLKKWVRSCHINELEKDASGVYPYRELFTLLKSIGYDRYTMCEVGKTPPSVEAGIAFLKEYKALWTKLANA
jgi:sugar phosphate isomerase/epimerase